MSTAAPTSRKSRDNQHMNHAQRRQLRQAIAQDIHDNYLTLEEAMRKYHTSIEVVRNAIRESGLFAPGTHIGTRATRKRAADLAASGMTLEAIAADLKISHSAVRKALKEHGIRSPKTSARGRALKILAALFDATRPQQEIAREFGVTRQYVSSIYYRAVDAGIPVPARSRTEVATLNPMASVSLTTIDL